MNLLVRCDGRVVGTQTLGTDDLVTGEVTTGSWLGRRHQGRGVGTEMRAAVVRRGRATEDVRLLLTPEWFRRPDRTLRVEGLDACRASLGVSRD